MFLFFFLSPHYRHMWLDIGVYVHSDACMYAALNKQNLQIIHKFYSVFLSILLSRSVSVCLPRFSSYFLYDFAPNSLSKHYAYAIHLTLLVLSIFTQMLATQQQQQLQQQ